MRTSLAVSLVAALAASSATHLVAAVIPPIGLSPGSQYQLVFVTYDAIPGTSPTEAPYNTFVNNEAALSPTLPVSIWSAVTSTADGTNANVNAPSPAGGLPVYNTAGQLVATAATGLYTGTLVNPILYDQYGNSSLTDPNTFPGFAWTGSLSGGVNAGGLSLGNQFVNDGNGSSISSSWIDGGVNGALNTLEVYALSSTLTVPTPEPATITLLGSGLLLGGMRLLRRRKGRR